MTNKDDGTNPVMYTEQVFAVATAENGPTDQEQCVNGTHQRIELTQSKHKYKQLLFHWASLLYRQSQRIAYCNFT